MFLLRPFLYFALLLASVLALIVRPHIIEAVRAGELNPLWILSAPILFGIFFLAYAIDEIKRSKEAHRRGRFAFASIVFGLVLIAFLFPSSFREYQARRTPDIATEAFFDKLLTSPDARIRTLVMMASSCQLNSNQTWATLLEKGLSDSDPMVQEAAKQAISQKFGIQFSDDDVGLSRAKNTLRDWSASFFVDKKSSP